MLLPDWTPTEKGSLQAWVDEYCRLNGLPMMDLGGDAKDPRLVSSIDTVQLPIGSCSGCLCPEDCRENNSCLFPSIKVDPDARLQENQPSPNPETTS
jgi:hypothetical protein